MGSKVICWPIRLCRCGCAKDLDEESEKQGKYLRWFASAECEARYIAKAAEMNGGEQKGLKTIHYSK